MTRKIIAILRGVKPNEVLELARTIADHGITQIEVPMNSPDVFDSIQLLHDEMKDFISVGAGTVTNTKQVKISLRRLALTLLCPQISTQKL